jgi:hypothetical protein
MRQALHILKKDMRGHWYEIAVTLAVTALFAFTGIRQASFWSQGGESRAFAGSLVLWALPLAWWALITRVIHSEALPGDRQFWLTRPYRKGSLLGAKVLFILLFVNLPMIVADTLIVSAYGFWAAAILPGLLWSQVLLTAVFLLPIAALSTLTKGLVQLVLTLTAIAVAFLAWSSLEHGWGQANDWFNLEWVRTDFIVASAGLTALTIVLFQYARRETRAARLIAVAGAIVVLFGADRISWPAAFWLQSRLSKSSVNGPEMRVHVATNRLWSGSVLKQADTVRVNIPLTIDGIPNGMEASPEGLTATFKAPDGSNWSAVDDPRSNIVSEGRLISLRVKLGKARYEGVKDVPIDIRGTLYWTMFGNERVARVTFENHLQDVPGGGRCAATKGPTGQSYFLLCDSAFRLPKDSVWAEWIDTRGTNHDASLSRAPSGSPFPAELGIGPIYPYSTYRALQGAASAVEVHALEPLGYVQRDFELKNLRLADFEQK